MTKESFAWVLIRFLGVILLIASLYFMCQLTIYLLFFISIDPIATVNAEGITTLRLGNINWTPLFNGFFCLAFATYFLKYGGFVHRLLLKNA